MTQFFNGQKILFINRILFDDAFITVVEVIFFSVYLKLLGKAFFFRFFKYYGLMFVNFVVRSDSNRLLIR